MNSKRIGLILLGIALLMSMGFWLIACLFACGQLYDTYDLWMYISDAPVAVAIIIALFVGAVASFVAAIRTKDS
ncbi:MAG: LapA family protein [Oscillospiraceae bacterium]|nr:LapA family protein [Oscillospiraceae bacterium]